MTRTRPVAALSVVATVALLTLSCAEPPQPPAERTVARGLEATSLLGTPLYPPTLPAETRIRMEADLAEARDAADASANDVEAQIWLGRRTAYLGRYQDAIEIYTDAIATFPDDPRLYRHRGHRYISVREFDRAIEDLERAVILIAGQPDRVEPDGQPNDRGIPTSTLHSNIYYHLALARYLTGQFGDAADTWALARAAVDNPDNLVAASHWLYLAMRRAGRTGAANVLTPITADLDVIENGSYHALLLMYKGERDSADLLESVESGASGSAVTYGVSAWLLLEDRTAEAAALWKRMVAEPDWASFGHIAAEAELARRTR